jgi:putative transcriptional regulator
MESLAGKLLIASPFLGDGNFNKSVVLIIQHSAEGAFGLVLNRPTEHRLDEVWLSVANEVCETDAVIHYGGPVEGPLMALHTRRSCSEHGVVPGVHFAASKEKLHDLLRLADDDNSYRVFSGYSGWGESQLESELEEGAWFTHPASRRHVFADDRVDLWKMVAQEIGNEVVLQKLNIKNVPTDPSVN